MLLSRNGFVRVSLSDKAFSEAYLYPACQQWSNLLSFECEATQQKSLPTQWRSHLENMVKIIASPISLSHVCVFDYSSADHTNQLNNRICHFFSLNINDNETLTFALCASFCCAQRELNSDLLIYLISPNYTFEIHFFVL